ncbi:hypothetical protein L1987_29028 [Smallanthus sonchifolius]|uniref:Uncharacterized protein n=1 Tax=Smallanthus sonchifolius TaxID=185202 RepID=A0ACB9I032_9ASTR|nr:hypothetical protein L1987_29028 [Smallanthus sonchifolius]
MTSPATIPTFILLLTCAAAAQIPTAYEILQEYDFPVGLLPTNVTSYVLNRDTGEFLVNLGNKCTFKNDGYDVKYQETISGLIRKDKLVRLKGVSVKLLIFWAEIVEATRDEGELDFSVGLLSAGFDVSAFEESPHCGCGFDCSEDKSRENNMMKHSKLLDWSM